MKKLFITVTIFILIGVGALFFYRGSNLSEETNQITESSSTVSDTTYSEQYKNEKLKIVVGYPEGYKIGESYVYNVSPGKNINGIKFTIPEAYAKGTNLSRDSYISVESIQGTTVCTADHFLDGMHSITSITDSGVRYSVAQAENAGAGNRYEETVYALSGTNPCIAVRYLIHHTVLQNYEPGTVMEFDRASLLREFDNIRHTLVIKQ